MKHLDASRWFTFILVLGFALTILSAKSPGQQTQPNVIVILSDDYGYGSAGCYGADSDLVRTPALDRLAREGRRFTDANTPSSVCTPTRYALLTGRYCWRTWLNTGKVLNTLDPLLIETDRPTLASLLKAHGYQTAVIGKWHLGYGTEKRVDYTRELKPGPLELGFDYQFAVPQNHNDVTRVFVENHLVYGLRSTKLNPASGKLGLDAPERVDTETMNELTSRAVQWIERQRSDQPFFLYFAPITVHELVTPSSQTQGSSKAGPYGDFIHDLDLSVGRILEVLDRLKLNDDTLIIFTSDNGGVVNEKSKSGSQKVAMEAGLAINGKLRGGKHDIWQGGFRVPFIVRWPNHVPAGTECDEMIGLVDVYATLAALVGDSPNASAKGGPDSFNMLPAILGETYTKPLRQDLLFQNADGVYAIRKGPWKWIEGTPAPASGPSKGGSGPRADQFVARLFHLEEDLGETTDVTDQNPSVVEDLSNRLKKVRQQGTSHLQN